MPKPLGMFRPVILPAPNYVNHIALTTSQQAFDVPASGGYALFSRSAVFSFAAKYGSTAVTYPTTNVLDGSGNELNPDLRYLGSTSGCTGFSVMGATAGGLLTVSWFTP